MFGDEQSGPARGTEGLFEALGLRIVQGRAFTATDAMDPESRVTLINEGFARELWRGGSAVGRRIGFRADNGIEW